MRPQPMEVMMPKIVVPKEYEANVYLADAYRQGWRHATGLSMDCLPRIGDAINKTFDWVGLGSVVTPENVKQYHEMLCLSAAWKAGPDFSKFGDGGFAVVLNGDPDDAIGPFKTKEEAIRAAEENGAEDYYIEDWPNHCEMVDAFETGLNDRVIFEVNDYDLEDYGFEPEPDDEEDEE
jgi:hypothetical protein